MCKFKKKSIVYKAIFKYFYNNFVDLIDFYLTFLFFLCNSKLIAYFIFLKFLLHCLIEALLLSKINHFFSFLSQI